MIEPKARSTVSERGVAKDDQSDQHTTQAVDVEVALLHPEHRFLRFGLSRMNFGCHAVARKAVTQANQLDRTAPRFLVVPQPLFRLKRISPWLSEEDNRRLAKSDHALGRFWRPTPAATFDQTLFLATHRKVGSSDEGFSLLSSRPVLAQRNKKVTISIEPIISVTIRKYRGLTDSIGSRYANAGLVV